MTSPRPFGGGSLTCQKTGKRDKIEKQCRQAGLSREMR